MRGYDNIAEPFLAAVRAHPHKAAVIVGDDVQDFAETNSRVNRINALLRQAGVRPGEKVAYLLPNSAVLIEVYYAAQKLGATTVPINFRSIPRELDYFLRTSDASVLFFAHAYAETVAAVQDSMRGVRLQVCVDGETDFAADLRNLIAGLPDDEPEMFRDPCAISRIQFTGGSTGAPKGVERSHRADLVSCEGTFGSNGLYADEAKVVLIQCPLEHHGGHAWFSSALSLGATLVVCATFDPGLILRQIEQHRVSYMILLPPTTLVRLMEDPAMGSHDMSSVRLVQSSAGGTNADIVAAVYRHFPNAVMNYGWGQTETGLGSSLVLTEEMAVCRLPRVNSVGTAMPLIELKVIDADGSEVPVGVLGECVARSEALMTGYYKQPEATAAAFTADGWLRTGDLMVRDADGYLYLKSRKRELIKSGGENVFIGEVENVIREHPAVLDALVYGEPDPVYIEAVAAVVELRPGRTLTLDELQDFVRRRLASYKKPRILTVLPTLDRDFSGKVRRDVVIRQARDQQARSASEAAVPDIATAIAQVSTDPVVYRVQMPLHPDHGPLSNAYLVGGTVPGETGTLLVDPGPGHDQAHGTLLRAVEHLAIDPETIDIFITHEHTDHAGLARRWARPGRRVVLGEAALDGLRAAREENHCAQAAARLAAAGFDPATIAVFEGVRRQASASSVARLDAVGAADGQTLTLGGNIVQVLATPGHTAGQACLYLPDAKLLFVGDHVLPGMVPGLFGEADGTDLLGHYLTGLDRVTALDVALALPGHGDPLPPAALAERARQLADHHEQRAAALLAHLEFRPGSTAAQLTAAELERLGASTWFDEPNGHHWAVASIVLARLDHLVTAGAVAATPGPDGLITYRAQ
jgi:acyl-CoA synthetase (AMP-forming)/AMP-acid ligase II/glyoxylase-like metal-dependent hydrolase (beta-lactamase superfamily II)